MIDYALVYVLGFFTPFIVKHFILPKLKPWLKEKIKEWK